LPRQLDHLVRHGQQQLTAFQTRQLEAAAALLLGRAVRRGLVAAAAVLTSTRRAS
jgi:hypothetical protein